MLTGPGRVLHGLHLYGAAGIATFGWAGCNLLDWDARPWLLYWFCAALLIYNADRLRHDPADAINVPGRVAVTRRLRRAALAVVFCAAGFLLLHPLFSRDWITLGLVVGGAFTTLNYSVPLLGFRFKDLPWLKTFFAPTIVTAAVFALPWLHGSRSAAPLFLVITTCRAWVFLLFNMTVCDLRDLEGDRRTGIRSLPVLLGHKATRRFLLALIVALELLFVAGWSHVPAPHRRTWAAMAICGGIYLGALLVAVRVRRSEAFYEWIVEGMLFLPAAACWL